MNAKAFFWTAIGVGAVVGAGLVAFKVTRGRTTRGALAGPITRVQRGEVKKLAKYARGELAALAKESDTLIARAKQLQERAKAFEASLEIEKDGVIDDDDTWADGPNATDAEVDDDSSDNYRAALGDITAPDADLVEHAVHTLDDEWRTSIRESITTLDNLDDY